MIDFSYTPRNGMILADCWSPKARPKSEKLIEVGNLQDLNADTYSPDLISTEQPVPSDRPKNQIPADQQRLGLGSGLAESNGHLIQPENWGMDGVRVECGPHLGFPNDHGGTAGIRGLTDRFPLISSDDNPDSSLSKINTSIDGEYRLISTLEEYSADTLVGRRVQRPLTVPDELGSPRLTADGTDLRKRYNLQE